MADSTNPLRLSDTAVLLLAANLTSVPQLESLRALIAGYPYVLHFTAVLELLLKILPETTSPEDYISVVYRSYRRENERFDPSRIPTSFIDEVLALSPATLRRKLAVFNLSNPPKSSANIEADENLLTQWFFGRARRVEEATGMIDLARRLVLPETASFNQIPPFPPLVVTVWGKGIIKVLETFIFDNDDEDELQLLPFENLDPDSAVRLLLSRTTSETVSRNIRNLVAPFADYINYQKQDKEIWTTVWDWLLDRTVAGELEYIANLSNDWIETTAGLSRDFLQTCLAACYLCHQSSPAIRMDLHRIYNNITKISQQLHIQQSDNQINLGHPETDLLATQLRKSSPLTALTASTLRFLNDIIGSGDSIAQCSIIPELALREIIAIREGSEESQRQLADRLLRSDQFWTKRSEEQWRRLRQSIKWLQNQSRVLGKISEVSLDTMILTAVLDASGKLLCSLRIDI
jgi:Secretory pathway protein Sec39